jgi:anaerobic selenocysteine-containing dehydrogenase
MHDRKNGTYLLPAATQFETYGSVTASNRSLQWREKVFEPLFESADHEIMYLFAKKFGFADEMFKQHPGERTATSRSSRTSPASSTAACGPSATPASRRSG